MVRIDADGTRPFEEVRAVVGVDAIKYYNLVLDPNLGKGRVAHGLIEALWATKDDRVELADEDGGEDDDEDEQSPPPQIPASCTCKWCCKWTAYGSGGFFLRQGV